MNNQQINLIKNTKNFLSFFKGYNFFPYKDSIFYLATYSNFIGSYILNSLNKENKVSVFKKFSTVLKDILYSLNYINCKIYKKNNKFIYNKIVVTWAFKNNFEKDGSLNDRYLNINSKNLKKTMWFVIYLDKDIPFKVRENIVLLKAKTKKSFNIFKILKILIGNFPFIFKSFKYYLALTSNYNYFSEIFLKKIGPFLNNQVSHILMPFEGQPFQNRLIYFVKKKHKNIKTIGYIHSPPLAVPSNFIYKDYSPDKIILNGIDQKYCFNKILGWKKKSIKILPSFRFIKSKKKITNTIFLPLTVRKTNLIVDSLKFLDQNKFINLKNYKVKNHPAALFSKKNIQTINKINEIKKRLENKKNYSKINYLIFIGSSGGIVEALERGSKVIQICEHPVFDFYSDKIWPSIKSSKLRNNVYLYTLKKRGRLINFGNKKKNLKKVFN